MRFRANVLFSPAIPFIVLSASKAFSSSVASSLGRVMVRVMVVIYEDLAFSPVLFDSVNVRLLLFIDSTIGFFLLQIKNYFYI